MAPMKKPPSETYQQLTGAVSLATVARRTGLPRRQVRRLIQSGKLPFVQVRGQIRVPRAEANQLRIAPRLRGRAGLRIRKS